jgi:hypothetical protein
VTVTISKPLFTPANVSKVFTFDTGSVNASNTAQQQLELLNITKLGHAAKGMDITITAVPVSGSPGIVNVGYINASGIDLGDVTVGGDLGRIAVGDLNHSTPGLHSLTVQSLGAQGLTTQLPAGNLNSLISGPVGAITVNGDVDGASVGIGGGGKGLLGTLLVTGNINGGAAQYSGSVRTQGGITSVEVDGSVIGGAGSESGIIGTAGGLGTVLVKGAIDGGGGAFSGAILSTKSMQSVTVDGDIVGGAGADSGQIGSAANLGTVNIESTVLGGAGVLSGTILAAGNIATVTVAHGLVGGIGADSGQIASGKYITTVTIGSYFPITPGLVPLDGTFQGIEGGPGASSGTVLAGGSITSATIDGEIFGARLLGAGLRPLTSASGPGAAAISAGGNIGTVLVTEGVYGGGILSGASIGTVTIDGTLSDGSEIHAHQNIQTVSVNASFGNLLQSSFTPGYGPGISNSSILADNGNIGAILAGGSGYSSAYPIVNASIAAGGSVGSIQALATSGAINAILNTEVVAGSLGNITASSNDGTAINASDFLASQGIGNISGITFSSSGADGILNSTFRAGAAIASIAASTADGVDTTTGGIVSSGFDAGGNIGPVNSTGSVIGSVFIAGIDLGPSFGVTGAGTFNNTSAVSFGFGSSKSAVASSIGAITLSTNDGAVPALIQQSTFLAGVHGPGVDKTFGTKDDLVATGSAIGAITSPGGLNTVFVESGNIGATHSGAILDSTYISTDTAVSAAGIGPITVDATGLLPSIIFNGSGNGAHPQFSTVATAGIYNSTFTSNAGIGDINVTLNGFRVAGDNSGISASAFQAGHAIGKITVTNNVYGTSGNADGIVNTTFQAGLNGNGGVGDINVTLTDSGSDGNTAAITGVTFDGSVCSCMGASIGSISVENADSASTAAGIVDSTFRVHGNIGPITSTMDNGSPTAPAIEGTTFSAYGSIGDINVYGAVLPDEGGPSRFLAGYDIGTDLTFGNEDLTSKSLALQGGQSVGNVTVSGYFEGSDIIASINPGSGYVFGDSNSGTSSSNDTHVGVGGTIGFINIGTNVSVDGSPFTFDNATSHAIEAKTFTTTDTPTVTAFGFTTDIPTVLLVDDGPNDVRITNLTQLSP